MKTFRLLAFVLVAWVSTGVAQTTQDLLNTGKNTDVLTTHSMGYDRKSYSPLRQINRTNVKRLVPVWTTSVWNEMGELAAPAIYNGVMYVINGRWTFALDARNGRQIWRTPVTLETGTTGAPITRGGPILYNGKLFRITYDNHLVALDMKTGKELWNQKYAEGKDGYYSTGAPIIANGVLISGMAGGERTTRGFLTDGTRTPGKSCGAGTPFPRPVNPAPRPGRATAKRGSTAEGPPGDPVPTTPSSISSTGAPATRSRTILIRVAGSTASIRRA